MHEASHPAYDSSDRADGSGHPAYDISDDKGRVDRDVVWQFLSTEAYWGRWRTRGDVMAQLDASWRVVGPYERGTGAMVGFARVLSDGVALAYLADLFVLPDARGRGIGAGLVEAAMAPPGDRMRWMLHTGDAHGLYARFGFAPPDSTYLERPRPE
ncbi:MAG TPA: GNAT family N-acetyltransferase [Dermatophilaceae bacterium]|nr:GNAT family N-acetyltransferase [Dermatophilaceae bacterium]